MCNPASFVLTKDKVFWSKTTNSHEDIIREHSLCADGSRGPNIMRVEISPYNGDYARPVKEWIYHTDQDILPPWVDADSDEKRTRIALKFWKKYHCCSQKAGDASTQKAGDDSTQKAGVRSTQITQWYDGSWHTAARVVDESTADEWYRVSRGVWRKCSDDEAAEAEKRSQC